MEIEYEYPKKLHCKLLLVLLSLLSWNCCISSSSSTTKRFHFNVGYTQVTKLCHTRQLLTVNGKYPGPTIAVNEGDHVEIKVTNTISNNTTIHWHGIRQMRTAWADGPAYITQCPIKGGQSYVYRFNVLDQRGTLLWHAHYSWQRASVYGAFIIYPRFPYPFHDKIQDEFPIILGEWWNADADLIANEMLMYGGGPNSSSAYTINGLPGPLYPCSSQDMFVQAVEPGKTYMLRIINAALNDELFFAVANHTLEVVEVDAVYTKRFGMSAIMVAPGQTTTVLLTVERSLGPSGVVPMAAMPYLTSVFPFDNSTTVGFFRYKNDGSNRQNSLPINVPNLPKMTDTDFATEFLSQLRSLASARYPCRVPKMVDKHVFITISLNLQDCPQNKTCRGYAGKMFFASMNNQSFVRPSTSILEHHYKNLTVADSRSASSFPERPPESFDFTGVNPVAENMNTEFGSKVLVIPYGTSIEIVLQDTGFLNKENHPIHVHGHNFFVVGQGFGNFDSKKDPAHYNLIDPPERNTVAVPTGGWAAIRLKADNPGAWFVHCHLEAHNSWGLAMAFIVLDGPGRSQRLLPPPRDLPSC